MLFLKGDLATRREAAWCINNLTLSGKREQVAYVLQQGVLAPFCHLLNLDDPQIVVVVLDGISNILKMASSNENDLAALTSQIEECGGLDKIEEMQSHRNEEIYKLAFDIIDKYYTDILDEDLLPNGVGVETTQFQFNVPGMSGHVAPSSSSNNSAQPPATNSTDSTSMSNGQKSNRFEF
jgi:hypothetical protein